MRTAEKRQLCAPLMQCLLSKRKLLSADIAG